MRLYICFILVAVMSCNTNQAPVSPRVNHVMLHVSDLERSLSFYEKAVGLQVNKRISELTFQPEDGEPAKVNVTMALMKFPGQDFVYEVAQIPPADTTTTGYGFQHVGFDVMDIDAATANVVAAGGIQLGPPRTVTGPGVEAKNVFFRGPDGELIELMQIISGEF